MAPNPSNSSSFEQPALKGLSLLALLALITLLTVCEIEPGDDLFSLFAQRSHPAGAMA